jgi:hypothetical protein
VRTIVVVGASPNWNRPSYFVMKYLQGKGYRLRLSLRFPQFLEVDLGAVPPSCRLNEDASKAPMLRDFPSLQQVWVVVAAMPSDTVIERRNRALIAFIMLTGVRDRALVSLPCVTST